MLSCLIQTLYDRNSEEALDISVSFADPDPSDQCRVTDPTFSSWKQIWSQPITVEYLGTQYTYTDEVMPTSTVYTYGTATPTRYSCTNDGQLVHKRGISTPTGYSYINELLLRLRGTPTPSWNSSCTRPQTVQ